MLLAPCCLIYAYAAVCFSPVTRDFDIAAPRARADSSFSVLMPLLTPFSFHYFTLAAALMPIFYTPLLTRAMPLALYYATLDMLLCHVFYAMLPVSLMFRHLRRRHYYRFAILIYCHYYYATPAPSSCWLFDY